MQFFGNFDKIICCHPLEGQRSHLQEILDPPLLHHGFLAQIFSGEVAYISALLLPVNLVAGRQCFQSYFSLYLFTVGSYVIIIQYLLDFNM